MNKAVFLDRDDTLIIDVPYNGDPDKVVLMPGARAACELLRQLDFLLVVVTNQSGVGRGKITIEDVSAVNERMLELLGQNLFSAIYCCYDDPHSPRDHCRKPSPRMLHLASQDLAIDLSKSFMIGDKVDDILAGKSAGCRTVLLNNKVIPHPSHSEADFCAKTIVEAAEWIHSQIE